MRIAPATREGSAFERLLWPALELAAEAIRRLRRLQPNAPLNLWLHDGPWWHVHLAPRLTVAAGIELGAGIDINALPAGDAAARLRDA
jgi:UDPglucose--hexose-1-phosphate uridylyltransferase